MSNQINEGAARYQAEIAGQNPPERSAALQPQSPQQLVTDHLDLWTSTVTPKSTSGRGRGSGKSSKLELTGIKKLRELILELAVRGKLVAQNPDDEPASKLLERIEAEKAQLIKDGKLKKQKPLPAVSDDEKPFELPQGWEWLRLGQVGNWAIGNGFPVAIQGESEGEVLLCKVSDMNLASNAIFIETTVNKVSINLAQERKFNIQKSGTVIFPKIGGAIATNKRRIIKHPTAIDNNCLGITPSDLITTEFLFLYLTALDMTKYQAGTSVPALSQGVLGQISFALPPLAEQQRIVAKVDELMALCDQLEQQSEHQLTAHQQLTDTLLATLTESANAQELNDNWQRLAQYFDLLFSGPMGAWAIDRLKDTILQLAVMGKLVPQNPEDEPASKLLERIEEEKTRLVKEGKIKKPKKLPPVSDDEKPFELPAGWSTSRLGELANFQKGHAFKSSEYINTGLMICKIQNLTENSANGCVYISPEKYNLFKKYVLNKNDIVMTTVGSWFSAPLSAVGRSFLVGKIFHNSLLNQNAVRIRPHEGLENSYVFMCINTPTFKTYMEKEAQGTANQASLTQESIQNFIVYTPPLPEQHRIVAKVDELFALCDQLKDSLQQASEIEQHLTNAIVEQALS